MADILTNDALNRAILARQCLLTRVDLPAVAAVERLAGMQAQAPAAPYLGLWTRLAAFRRSDLEVALRERTVVRATLMRATLHLVTAADYLRLRAALQPVLSRTYRSFFKEQAARVNVARVVESALPFIGAKPRTLGELRDHLARLWPGEDPAGLVFCVRMHLPLVQASSDEGGRAGQPRYVAAEAWLGAPLGPEDEGRRHLVRSYLAAFGPATVRDIEAWSGLSRLRATVDELRPTLRTFRDAQGRELLDVPDGPLPDGDTPIPVRFLPEWDSALLAHADRERILPAAYRSGVLRPPGRVLATFLADGYVAGTWRAERAGPAATLHLEPFTPLPQRAEAALREEGERLLAFVAEDARDTAVRVASGGAGSGEA